MFDDGNSYTRIQLKRSAPLPSETLDQRIADLRCRYPKLEVPEHAKKITATPNMVVILDDKPSRQELEKYNASLDRFYIDFREHLQRIEDFSQAAMRRIEFQPILLNDGGFPAEDIDIFMHFPDGFRLLNKGDWPAVPTEPQHPNVPKGPRESFMAALSAPLFPGIMAPDILSMSGINKAVANIGPGPNVSNPKIRKSNSYDVELCVRELKHHFQISLGTLYAVFDSWDTAKSFQVTYKLLAANLPQEVEGSLNVIIEVRD
jgi:hypothetical protein